MGNVTDTMTRSLKTTLQLSLALVVLLGLSASPAMAQLTPQSNERSTADKDGSADVITQAELEYATASEDPDDVIYEITSSPATSEGQLKFTSQSSTGSPPNQPLSQGSTFSQRDINDGILVYEYGQTGVRSDGFNFEVDDGNDTDTDGFRFDIVDSDPIANNDDFGTIDEDEKFTGPSGNGEVLGNVLNNDEDTPLEAPDGGDLEVSYVDLVDDGAGNVGNPGGGTSVSPGSPGTITSSNGNGTFELTVFADGSVELTPGDNNPNAVEFNYAAQDSEDESKSATATVEVDNLPPTANDDELATEEGMTRNLSGNNSEFLDNDTDPAVNTKDGIEVTDFEGQDASTNSTFQTDEGGTLNTGGDRFADSYDPPSNFTGEDTFTYTIEDQNGGSGMGSQGTVTITVYQSGVYVDGESSSGGSGTPVDPYQSLQDGIDNTSNGDDLYIADATYNEDVEVGGAGPTNGDRTFKGWNGQAGSDYEVEVPVDAQIGGNFRVGSGNADADNLILFEGFTLAFQTNDALTLTDGVGILGEGRVEARTPSGQFTIELFNDDGNASPPVTATIVDLRVNKPNGSVVLDERGAAFDQANINIESRLDIGEGTPGQPFHNGRLSVEGGVLDAQDTDIVLFGGTTDQSGDAFAGDDSNKQPPLLNVESNPDSPALTGTSALTLDLEGEKQFTSEPSDPESAATLDILLRQNSAPVNTTSDFDEGGTELYYPEIGNGGTSVVATDSLFLPETVTVNGDLRASSGSNTTTAVLASSLTEVTGDLSVLNGAEVEVGRNAGSFTGDDVTAKSAPAKQEVELSVGTQVGEGTPGGGAGNDVSFPGTNPETGELEDVPPQFPGEREGTFDGVGEGEVENSTRKIASTPSQTALDINVTAEFSGVFEVDGSNSIVDFAETVTFTGDYEADGGSRSFFNDEATFGDESSDEVRLLGAETQLSFEVPGSAGTETESTVAGDLTHGSPQTNSPPVPGIVLEDSTSTTTSSQDTDLGSHSLELKGDLRLTDGNELLVDQQDDGDTPRTTSFDFTGTEKQEIVDVNDNGGSVAGLDRVELDNAASPRALELVNGVSLEVGDLLTLTDGNFVTNGGLDMSDGLAKYTPVLVRRSEGQNDTGRLTDGTGNFAYTGVDADPVRIEYRGSSNMATTEELLPADQDEGDRSVEELAVIFEGDPIEPSDEDAAVLTLGIDFAYTVEDVLAVRKGNLAFSAQSSLELGNEATFIRGDGELITEEVTDPNLGLVRPGVSTVQGRSPGADGFDITYVNELVPIATGVAFNKADTSQVRNLTVNNASDDESPVRLADLSALGNSNLGDGVHVNTGYFRVNRDVEVTSGSVFDFSAQELEVNTTENVGFASFRVVNDGSIVGGDEDAEDGSLLEFIGEGKVDAFGKVNVSSSDIDDDAARTFVFPATDVNKVDGGSGGLRRVEFQMEDANDDQADGFEFDGDFRMLAAANWSPSGNADGVEFRSVSGGSELDRNRVDKVIVNGDFVQQGGSLLAFADNDGVNDDRTQPDTDEDSEFTVNGDFTKDAAESSRFYVGGGGGSVANFTVGTGGEENTLSQANGTFYVIVQDNFTVNGDVENESPDKWTDKVVGTPFAFESEAFEVKGILDNNRNFDLEGPDNTAAEITGSVLQDTTGTPVFDDETTDEIENAGTFRIEGFVDDPDNDDPEGDVSVAGDFTNAKGISEIADATEASVGGAVTVQSDSMSVNLGSGNNEVSENVPGGQQVFTTTSLTVDASGGSGGAAAKSFHDPDAVFETSTQSSVATPSDLSDEPANPEPGAFAESDTSDYVEITGATDVQSSGQLFLEGFELKQGGDFTLLGFGDRPWAENEGLSYTEDESGLLGLVRFVNDGTEPQTITTDESASTYFHGLAVNATGDVELGSDVATNEASGGQGTVSSNGQATASGTLRPFGTLFLENGNLFTRDNRITILAPKPSDGEDLVEAVSADESRNGNPVDASPVLGGSNTTKVVGTMRRALAEQNEDTGGVVTDGYVYPLGKAGQENRPRYRGLVLELPSDETEPEFFTVENIDDPNEPLPDGGITSVDANESEGTIQLDEQSLPYYRVESEDGNPNFNSFNMRVISDIGGVREVNQVRLIQRNGDWMQAGGDGAYDRNRGSEIDDDEQETTGGPNASISGFTNVVHEGVDLRDGNTIALATSSDINPNFGQFDAPGLTLASDQDAEVNAAVGEGGVDINFNVDDPDTDPANYSFSLAGGTASSIDPDDVSFQSDGTVTFVPDTENAEASFTDDESRLPLDQFEGSDPLTLEVEVEDEAGNADVASVGVNVDLQPGDADSDGNVGSASENAQDAQVALDEFLQGPDVDSPSELAPVAFNAADVGPDGGNGRVEPFDASLILSGDVGSGSSALAGKSAQGGEVVIGSVENGAIPLTLSEDASGIRSASVELSLDASVSDVSANLPSGWIIDHATKEDGTLRVGLAGTSALSSGQQIASIQLDGSAAKASTDLEPEGTYRLNGSDAKDVRVDIGPEEFALEGNYPNPFTQATTIPYQLSESADVTLEVYDMLGRKIGTLVDKQQSSGQYEVNVNQSKVGQSLSSGVYIYRLEAGDFQDTGKMTVVK